MKWKLVILSLVVLGLLPLPVSYGFEYKNIACGNSGQTYSIRFPDAYDTNRPKVVELIDGRKCIGNLILDKTINEINSNAFNGSTLESVTIPDSVTKIGSGAFAEIKTLKTITFGKSLKEIGSEAFYNASGLESIVLPASLESIGHRAFKNTSSLKVLKILESLTQSVGINIGIEFLAGSAVQSYVIPYGSSNRFHPDSFWASAVSEIIFCDKLQEGSVLNFNLPIAVSCPPFRVAELNKLKIQENAKPTPTPTPTPTETRAPSAKPSPTPAVTASASATPTAAPTPSVVVLKKTTIICVKGKLTKKVTAVKPKCPSGYKLMK
jgi:hypothetical protein